MAHGIMAGIDKGAVGFCKEFGGTWHNCPEYVLIDGEISVEKAKEVLGYEVVKLPLTLFVPEYLQARMPKDIHGKMCKGMYVLARQDTGTIIHNISVTDDYTVYQNNSFLEVIEKGVLASNPNLAIESCGSLFGGKKAFVNIIIDRFQVKKDPSETLMRLMYTNAFGGLSVSACAHETRVVCNNTHMIAEAQGAANETLRKFRHTTGVQQKVDQYMVELTKLKAITDAHKEALDHLAGVQMSVDDVSCFLGNLFPIPTDAKKKTTSTRSNKQAKVQEIFETAADLQGPLMGTRYGMFQAVTNYSAHETETDDIDAAFVWNNIVSGGNRHELNKKAFDILIEDEIPEPGARKLMLA
jgi:phage/plasmid-like protein (TIGR03299 family)